MSGLDGLGWPDDTPLTDKCARGIDQSNFEDSWKDDFEEYAWVPADFARDLERAARILMEEYEDRRAQWGSEYLWSKHESTEAVNAAIEFLKS